MHDMEERREIVAVRNVLASHEDIELGFVFGSFAQGTETARSDIDVGVAASRPLTTSQRLDLLDALADSTGRTVDLVDLRLAGPLLLTEALTKGVCLIRRRPATLAELMVKMWGLNADYMPLVQRIQSIRRERFLHG